MFGVLRTTKRNLLVCEIQDNLTLAVFDESGEQKVLNETKSYSIIFALFLHVYLYKYTSIYMYVLVPDAEETLSISSRSVIELSLTRHEAECKNARGTRPQLTLDLAAKTTLIGSNQLHV